MFGPKDCFFLRRCQYSKVKERILRQFNFSDDDLHIQENVMHVLNNSLVLDEKSLTRLSFQLVAPKNAYEKQRFHELKA